MRRASLLRRFVWASAAGALHAIGGVACTALGTLAAPVRTARQVTLAVPVAGQLPDGRIDLEPPPDWQQVVTEVNDQAREAGRGFRLRLVGMPPAQTGGEREGPGSPTALEAMLAAVPPDLVGLTPPGWLFQMVERRLLQPLDVLLQTRRPLPLDSFPPAVLNAVRLRGGTYAIPVEVTPLMLWFDPRLFDAQSTPYPDSSWSWERLGEAAAALTLQRDRESGADQWGLRGTPEDLFIWQAGGEIVSPDGRRVLLRGEPARRAAQFIADLFHRYRALPPPLPPRGGFLAAGSHGLIAVDGAGGVSWRVAMAYWDAPSRRFSDPHPLRLAEVPRGRVRATKVRVAQALALTALAGRTADAALALQAAAALLERFEARGYLSGRQVQPARPGTETVIDQESRLAVARSFAYARTLPLDLERAVASVLGAKLVMPLRDGTATPEQAVEAAALALEALVAQAR